MNTPATYLQKCDKANPEEHTKEYLMYNYGIEASKFEARLVESLDEIKSFHHTTLKTLLGMIEEMVEEMPAFTCCSDKCMGKVSDEAKTPAYGTNYLQREKLLSDLKIIKNSLEK